MRYVSYESIQDATNKVAKARKAEEIAKKNAAVAAEYANLARAELKAKVAALDRELEVLAERQVKIQKQRIEILEQLKKVEAKK